MAKGRGLERFSEVHLVISAGLNVTDAGLSPIPASSTEGAGARARVRARCLVPRPQKKRGEQVLQHFNWKQVGLVQQSRSAGMSFAQVSVMREV